MRAALLLAALLAACGRRPAPVAITVTRNGYEPWRIEARRGVPLELVVTRITDETCATEIVIPDAGVDVPLPLGEPVRIAFTPERTGPLRFSCRMRMFQGVVEVR
ncbi:MAG TPA: cupredoxin domain-containing protein [Anaeromyxobacter sp.]|nr:cupredoxin domain-containing protein [Anaeromyxobacter sp.]